MKLTILLLSLLLTPMIFSQNTISVKPEVKTDIKTDIKTDVKTEPQVMAQTEPEKGRELKPITLDEELFIVQDEKKILALRIQLSQFADLQNKYDAANKELQKDIDSIYSLRHLTQKEAALCDGPGPIPCEKAPVDHITLQPINTPEVPRK